MDSFFVMVQCQWYDVFCLAYSQPLNLTSFLCSVLGPPVRFFSRIPCLSFPYPFTDCFFSVLWTLRPLPGPESLTPAVEDAAGLAPNTALWMFQIVGPVISYYMSIRTWHIMLYIEIARRNAIQWVELICLSAYKSCIVNVAINDIMDSHDGSCYKSNSKHCSRNAA